MVLAEVSRRGRNASYSGENTWNRCYSNFNTRDNVIFVSQAYAEKEK